MNNTKLLRLLAPAVATAMAATLSVPGPATAAVRYDFAYGGGQQARLWLASQWNPGTCTINVDHNVAKSHPQTNQVDSVVIKPSERGLSGKVVSITWGAAQTNPTGSKLLVRFVDMGPAACPNSVVTLTGPGTRTITIPAGANVYMVVTATEGTVQPWFSV